MAQPRGYRKLKSAFSNSQMFPETLRLTEGLLALTQPEAGVDVCVGALV